MSAPMATKNTPSAPRRAFARLRSGLLIVGQALLLILLAATGYGYILVAAAAIN